MFRIVFVEMNLPCCFVFSRSLVKAKFIATNKNNVVHLKTALQDCLFHSHIFI